MGHCSASDVHSKRFGDLIEKVNKKVKCVDDTVLSNTSIEEVLWHSYGFLDMCGANRVTLRPGKFRSG